MGISIPNLNLPCWYRLETSEERGKLSARKKIGKESNDELSQAKGKVSIDNYHLFCRTQERKVSFPRAGGIAKGKKKENTFFEVKYFFFSSLTLSSASSALDSASTTRCSNSVSWKKSGEKRRQYKIRKIAGKKTAADKKGAKNEGSSQRGQG